jgi:hypothetical protein
VCELYITLTWVQLPAVDIFWCLRDFSLVTHTLDQLAPLLLASQCHNHATPIQHHQTCNQSVLLTVFISLFPSCLPFPSSSYLCVGNVGVFVHHFPVYVLRTCLFRASFLSSYLHHPRLSFSLYGCYIALPPSSLPFLPTTLYASLVIGLRVSPQHPPLSSPSCACAFLQAPPSLPSHLDWVAHGTFLPRPM